MGKSKNDYAYVEGVGLFQSREAAMIYDYVLAAEGGATVPVEWTRLRDAMFGELSFMEHDEFALFEIEVLNPALAEIAKRTGDQIEFELSRPQPGEPFIHFIHHAA
ncbi:MAG: hypothetical protein LPJ91_05545 [Pseudazoarcus pumilus]|nr:hypothetical protein [Pseudazoarcus pumilus]